MTSTPKLSAKEFEHMLKLLKRYVNTEMDQWELWSFDTHYSRIYIQISMKAFCAEEAFTNFNHILEQPDNQ